VAHRRSRICCLDRRRLDALPGDVFKSDVQETAYKEIYMNVAPKNHLTHLLFAVGLLAGVVIGTTQPMRADLFSVAFKTYNPFGNSPLISGPEPAATVANSAFGAANVWNNLHSPYALGTNPSWSNLVDNSGTATSVSFSVAGTIAPIDLWPWIPNPDPLRSAFIAWNSWTSGGGGFGAGESTSISWSLTGLAPNATYDMFIYGSVVPADGLHNGKLARNPRWDEKVDPRSRMALSYQ
jgi:hypothetical protein